ncbi:FCN2-like protein, partial [Mya arenaria]
MTAVGPNELRIDIMDFNGTKAYEVYSAFRVGLGTKYTLHIGKRTRFDSMHGNYTMMDTMYGENGMQFSTWDKDVDNSTSMCSHYNHGGWWYNDCSTKNLNGQYNASSDSGMAVVDYSYMFPGRPHLRETKMMFRR